MLSPPCQFAVPGVARGDELETAVRSKIPVLEMLRANRFRRSQKLDGFVLRGRELAAESPDVFHRQMVFRLAAARGLSSTARGPPLPLFHASAFPDPPQFCYGDRDCRRRRALAQINERRRKVSPDLMADRMF